MQPTPFGWAKWMAEVEKKLLDLARRISKAGAEWLNDLRDVDVFYDGETPPEVGDVLTYQGNKVWAPAASGAAGGVATVQMTGTYQGGVGVDRDGATWEYADGIVSLTAGTGAGSVIATLDTPGPGETSGAGVWLFTARVFAAAEDVTQLLVLAPNFALVDDPPGSCRRNYIMWTYAGGDDVEGVTVAGHLVLADGWNVELSIQTVGTTEIAWAVDAHYVAPFDVDLGDCGA